MRNKALSNLYATLDEVLFYENIEKPHYYDMLLKNLAKLSKRVKQSDVDPDLWNTIQRVLTNDQQEG